MKFERSRSGRACALLFAGALVGCVGAVEEDGANPREKGSESDGTAAGGKGGGGNAGMPSARGGASGAPADAGVSRDASSGRDDESPGGGRGGSSTDAASAAGGRAGVGGGGASGAAGTPAGGSAGFDDSPPAGYVRGAVGVGYGGIRVLSRDGGKTWMTTAEVRQNGGDDRDLLRSVTYGRGLWVAGGWDKWWTSPDGSTWTLRPHKFGIIQGLAYGNGMFIATIIDGKVLRSTDGLMWASIGDAGSGSHSRVVFGNGLFAASGDPGQTYTSPDGTKWEKSPVPGIAAFCDGTFKSNTMCYGERWNAGSWIDGTWLRASGGSLQISADGRMWKSVFDPRTNSVDSLSIGWVPAP